MSKLKRGFSFFLSLLMLLSLLTVVPFTALGGKAQAKSYANSGTITSWYTAMTNLNGEQTKAALVDKYFDSLFATNSTFRTRIQVSAGGTTFRVKLTNYYGSEDIKVNKMNVGLAGSGNATSVNGSSVVNVTVNGSASFTIPKGGYVWTDWFTLKSAVSSGGYLVFSTYVKNSGKVRDAGLTGSISYCWSGDQMTNYEWSYGALGKLSKEDANVGDYNITPLLNCLEVKTSNPEAYSAMIIGDSTVTNYIPSLLQSKLRGEGVRQVAVIGAGIKGNELLADGVGPDGPLEGDALLRRFDMDALNLAGVKKVFVKIGINDIVHPNCSNLKDYFDGTPSAEEIINGYKQLIAAAHAKGIEIYFFDISPWIGYTREGTVTTDEAVIAKMENVRLEVNQWLHDNATSYVDSDYMTVDPIEGDSFGLVTTSDVIGVERSGHPGQQVLADAYTTDHIHYTLAGQNVVTSNIPISIFKGVLTGDAANKVATVGNLYIATTATSGGSYYFFGSDEKLPAGSTDQQGTIYLMATDENETKDIKSKISGGDGRGAAYDNPVCDIVLEPTTLQKGTVGAPYFSVQSTVENGSNTTVPVEQSYKAAYWLKTSNTDSEIRWRNHEYSYLYLGWYFPTGYRPDVFDTGVRKNINVKGTSSSEWYSFNTITALDASTSYKSYIYHGTVLPGINSDKYLSFFYDKPDENKWSDVVSGYSFRGVKDTDHNHVTNGGNLVTLYAPGTVDTQLDIASASKAQTFYNGANGTVVTFNYTLSDNLLNSPTMNATGKNVNNLTYPTNNFKTYGSFTGYTYGAGADRSVSFTSDNEAVAKIDSNGNVVLTGQGGTANLTMTVTWKELDGTVYTMTDTATVTNITYGADICIDGYYPDAYSFENYVGNASKDVSVTYTSVPLAALPAGGSWVWTSADSSIFTVSGSGSNATLHFTDKAGTANLTAAYVKNGVTYCSDTVAITNITAFVDIQIGSDAVDAETGAYPDFKLINGINPGDTLSLKAQPVGVGASALDMESGTYAWSIVDEQSSGVTISDTDKRTAKLTFDGSDTTVTLKLTYTLGNKTYESYVAVVVKAGVGKSNAVLDFGLPVDIELTGNASGVSATAPKTALDTGISASDEFGVAKSAKTASGTARLTGNTLTYTPEKILDSKDNIYYSAAVDNGYKYANISIIPATSVYYEDSFVSYSDGWTALYDDGKSDAVIAGIRQSAGNEVYGYDPAYGEYTNYSLGKAMTVTVAKGGDTATAEFTFTGTGFELYSATTSTQGGFKVSVYDAGGKMVGTKKLISTKSYDSYWQIPVFENSELPYGTYTVKIEVAYSPALDLATADGAKLNSVSFILDGVRIYNNELNKTYGDVYAKDGEYNAQYIEVRDQLINAKSFNSTGSAVNGAVYIDGRPQRDAKGELVYNKDGYLVYDRKVTTSNVLDDYKNYGPKNEVYLASGQGIAFRIEDMSNVESVQLGLKSASGETVSAAVNGTTVAVGSSTEMYYKVSASDGKVVITNNGNGIISVTNVKLTYKLGSNATTRIIADADLMQYAVKQILKTPAGAGLVPVSPTPAAPAVEPTANETQTTVKADLKQVIAKLDAMGKAQLVSKTMGELVAEILGGGVK